MDSSDLNKMVRRHKAALTVAKKNSPEAVILACDRALKDFEEFGYPDNWNVWNMARYDAEGEIARRSWTPGQYEEEE